MNTRDVAIATMTLGRDMREQTLLHAALRELAAAHIPVYLTDGGSGEDFVDELRRFPGFNVCEPRGAGLWPQVRRSLEAARKSGARFILYAEPDKREFFSARMATFIADAPDDGETGVVLAARSQAALSTFPPFQQFTESVINRCCAEVIGQSFDYSYGPFLLNGALVDQLNGLEDDIGWGWRTHAFGIAHRMGLTVEHIVAGCSCPADQREDCERTYRMLQLAQSIEGLVLSTKARPEQLKPASAQTIEPKHRQ
jgi:hypothetical protein